MREIEARNMPYVDLVVTVSEGIAKSLRNLYGLAQRPLVIRNLPRYRPSRFARSGSR